MKTLTYKGVTYTCPFAELLPPLMAEERAALHDSIRQHGVLCPISVTTDNEVLDGHNRLEIAAELHVEVRFTIEYCADAASKLAKALSLNIDRRHLSREQRRGIVAKVLKANPEKSNRQIAAEVKVDDKTVAAERTRLEATAEIPQLKSTTGRDGKARRTRAAIKTPPVPSETSKSIDDLPVVMDPQDAAHDHEETKRCDPAKVVKAWRAELDSIYMQMLGREWDLKLLVRCPKAKRDISDVCRLHGRLETLVAELGDFINRYKTASTELAEAGLRPTPNLGDSH